MNLFLDYEKMRDTEFVVSKNRSFYKKKWIDIYGIFHPTRLSAISLLLLIMWEIHKEAITQLEHYGQYNKISIFN